MQDYPAPPSMNTEWFAVDANENIAIFNSGEGGAVPRSYIYAWGTAQMRGLQDLMLEMCKNHPQHLIKLKVPGEVVAKSLTLKELQAGIDQAVEGAEKIIGRYISGNGIVTPIIRSTLEEQKLRSWLLLLASDDVIPQLKIEEIEDNYIVRFAGEATIIYVTECRVVTIQRLINEGQVLAGKTVKDYGGELASLFGLFAYDQDSSAPLPYTLKGKPIAPLLLEDLPAHIQDSISWIWFENLQFAQSTAIQPIEHTPCATWQHDKWWVDTQGQEHDEHPCDRK